MEVRQFLSNSKETTLGVHEVMMKMNEANTAVERILAEEQNGTKGQKPILHQNKGPG